MSEQKDFVARWLNDLLAAIDTHAGSEAKSAILQECARQCTEPWAREAQEIREAAKDKDDVDALLEAFKVALPAGEPDLNRHGDVITWRFSGGSCPCPVQTYVAEPEFCQCGVGHVKGMLEPLLGRPLEVELLRSRQRGDDDCMFVVHV